MLPSDLSPDSLLADGTSSVLVTLRRPDGRTTIAVAGALRRAVAREARPFDGIYLTGDETVWHLPAAALGTGLEPQPGDTIASGSEVWSIITPRLETLATRWRCLCRKRP